MPLKKIIIPICISIFFIIVGIIAVYQGNALKKRCTEKVTGIVVELSRESNSDNGYTYYPVIEYNAGNKTVTQKSRSGQNPPKYQESQEVEILYNPDNIYEYIIEGDKTASFLGFFS